MGKTQLAKKSYRCAQCSVRLLHMCQGRPDFFACCLRQIKLYLVNWIDKQQEMVLHT